MSCLISSRSRHVTARLVVSCHNCQNLSCHILSRPVPTQLPKLTLSRPISSRHVESRHNCQNLSCHIASCRVSSRLGVSYPIPTAKTCPVKSYPIPFLSYHGAACQITSATFIISLPLLPGIYYPVRSDGRSGSASFELLAKPLPESVSCLPR